LAGKLKASLRNNKASTEALFLGGNGFFQGHPMERIIRDCRAMHFHPLPEQTQLGVSGRFMLRLSPF
jgi:alkylation response protein AidB-like acyl-CoA dehydrogenase